MNKKVITGSNASVFQMIKEYRITYVTLKLRP